MAYAVQIHAFIEDLHRQAEPTRLIAHCFGGVSRSSAVAIHAGDVTGVVPVHLQEGSRVGYAANDRLLSILRCARAGLVFEEPEPDFSHPDSFIGAGRPGGI